VSSFDIYLDDDNEIRFGVNVEGSEKHDVKCRLMMETSSAMSLFFPGNRLNDGEVQVIVPSLKNILREGVYPVKLEVLIDDRVFVPLEMSMNIRPSVRVTAEAKVTPIRKGPRVTASVLTEAPVVEQKEEPKPKVKETRRRKQKTIKQQRQKPRKSNVISDKDFKSLIEKVLGN